MEPALQAGDDILYVGMSSGISGSFASAKMAIEQLKAKYPERDLRAVDTLSASLAEGIVVLKAVEYVNAGMDIENAGENIVGIAHADCAEDAEHLAARLREIAPPKDIIIECYEPVTGAHVGPDTLALFFVGKPGFRSDR